MKALFLDVDGVLNTGKLLTQYANAHKNLDCICPDRMKMIRKIVDATGCVVVLSSSWRLYPTMFKKVATMAQDVGVVIHDSTPDLPLDDRSVEIQTWCILNSVTTYAVLDDLSLTDPNLFKTNMRDGLTDSIVDAVITHLNK